MGFEPTCRLITDNSISSRARYGLFATFPRAVFVFYMKSRPRASPFSGTQNAPSVAGTRLKRHGAALGHVGLQLLDKGIKAVEALFLAQFRHEAHFELAAIDIASTTCSAVYSVPPDNAHVSGLWQY